MKLLSLFRIGYLCLFALLLQFAAIASDAPVPLKRAMSMNKITVNASSPGCYCGDCLHLQLTNNTSKDINLTVDPGLVFVPEDTSYQNLVAWGGETLTLKASATQDLNLKTFCGKSYAHAPRANLKFKYWKQSDSGLIRTLVYAKEKQVSPSLVQSAVWVFTNGHSIRSTYYDGVNSATKDFVKFVANIKHKPMPKYYTYYKRESHPGQYVVNMDSMKIIVPMQWGNDAQGVMYVNVFKENGDIYRKIEADRVIDKDGTTVLVEFNQWKDPKGKYKVQAKDKHGKIWNEKMVEVGVEDDD